VERAFEAQWKSSGHADATAEAFVHWDEDDPAVVSETCLHCTICHTIPQTVEAGEPVPTIPFQPAWQPDTHLSF